MVEGWSRASAALACLRGGGVMRSIFAAVQLGSHQGIWEKPHAGRPQPSGGGAEAVLLLHTTSTRHGNPGKGKKKKDNQLDGHLTLQPPLDSSHGWRGDDSIFPVSASTPSSVINKVCSNCALRPPSFVTAVQSSAHKLL